MDSGAYIRIIYTRRFWSDLSKTIILTNRVVVMWVGGAVEHLDLTVFIGLSLNWGWAGVGAGVGLD